MRRVERRGLPLAFVVVSFAAATALSTPPVAAAGPEVARCLASSEKATALRHANKLIDARAELLLCADDSCPGDVRAECARVLDLVVAKEPTLVFAPTDGAGTDLPDVRVTMDGALLAERCDGTALTVDPGEHDFVFTDARGRTVAKHLVVREGEKDRREVVVFATPKAHDLAAHASTTWGRVALGAAGVGLAGILLGAAAGGVASGEWDDAKRDCGKACPAGSVAQNERATAVNWASVSTGSFIAGGALVGAGAILWLTAPRDPEAPPPPPAAALRLTPVLGPGGLGANASLTF